MQTQARLLPLTLLLILILTLLLPLLLALVQALFSILISTSIRAETQTQRTQARVPLHLTQTHFSIGPVTTCSLTTLTPTLGSTGTTCHPVLLGPPVRA